MADLERSIVMPVFKEGEAGRAGTAAADDVGHCAHQILVVYDFDEDPTVPVVERMAVEFPSIRPMRNDIGRGVLNAERRAFGGAQP